MSSSFVLHENFSKKHHVIDLQLCRVLMEPVNEFPWLMLVPMRSNIKNILDLSAEDKQVLWHEIDMISDVMNKIYKPDQLNIAMLGNVTPQLHVHIIARFENDSAWPDPVFGRKCTVSSIEDLIERANAIKSKYNLQYSY